MALLILRAALGRPTIAEQCNVTALASLWLSISVRDDWLGVESPATDLGSLYVA